MTTDTNIRGRRSRIVILDDTSDDQNNNFDPWMFVPADGICPTCLGNVRDSDFAQREADIGWVSSCPYCHTTFVD